MDALSGLLNARVVACNNIRANTCVLYHFLGWQAERLPALLPPWRTRCKGLAAGGAGSKFCSLAGTG